MRHGRRGMARARGRRAPERIALADPRRELVLRRAARPMPRPARGSSRPGASRPVSRSRSRCPRAWPSRRRCTPACCSARLPCPSTAPARERARADRAGVTVLVEEPLPGGHGGRAGPRPRRHDLGAPPLVDPHLRHDRCPAPGRADATATSSGAPSARQSRSASIRGSAGCARLPLVARRRPLDPAPLGDLRDHGGRPRALRDRPRVHALRSRAGVTLVSLVATTLDAPARGGPRATRRRCAARSPAAARSRRPCSRAPMRPACPSASPTASPRAARRPPRSPLAAIGARALDGGGPPLFCTRVQIAADGEILLRRADRRAPADRGRTAGCTRRSRRASTSAAACRCIGRKADTIVSGGENVAPTEVEAVLEAHPQVLRGGGARPPDDRWGEAVACDRRPPRGRPPTGDGPPRALRRARSRPTRSRSRSILSARAAPADAPRASSSAGSWHELRRRGPPRAQPRGWEDAAAGWVSRQRTDACVSWTRRRCRTGCSPPSLPSPASGCSSSRRGSARPACSPPSWSRRSAASSSPTRPRRCSRERARGRPSSGSRTSSSSVLNAEWIDLPLASVDVGALPLGLHADGRPAPRRSPRRAACCARAGGSALAVWDAIDGQPVGAAPRRRELRRARPRRAARRRRRPGPFALGDPDRVRELLAGAGFAEIAIEASSCRAGTRASRSCGRLTLDLSPRLPRRRPLAARGGDRGDPGRAAGAASPRTPPPTARSRCPGARSSPSRERLTARRARAATARGASLG